MQGDTNVSGLARDVMQKVLSAGGADAATAQRIVAARSRPLPGGDPLSPADTALVDQSLASAVGRPLVDAMDQPAVTPDDVVASLQASAYFSAHPRNFAHLQACAQAGEARLPAREDF